MRIPSHLEPAAYATIEDLMLLPQQGEGKRPSMPFGAMMMQAVSQDTQAYFMTANSAIPVADSVRGFYEAIREDIPFIGYVRADASVTYSRTKTRTEERLGEEVERLTPLVRGFKRVAIIDQFVYTGRTLEFAGKILAACGVANSIKMRGYWYGNAAHPEVDHVNVTSVHAPFMREVGMKSAVIPGNTN